MHAYTYFLFLCLYVTCFDRYFAALMFSYSTTAGLEDETDRRVVPLVS